MTAILYILAGEGPLPVNLVGVWDKPAKAQTINVSLGRMLKADNKLTAVES